MDEMALAEYTTKDALTHISFKLVMFVNVASNVATMCFSALASAWMRARGFNKLNKISRTNRCNGIVILLRWKSRDWIRRDVMSRGGDLQLRDWLLGRIMERIMSVFKAYWVYIRMSLTISHLFHLWSNSIDRLSLVTRWLASGMQ